MSGWLKRDMDKSNIHNKTYDELKADHAQLVALVKALPKVDDDIDIMYTCDTSGYESFELWTVNTSLGSFEKEEQAEAYKALLQARKALG